MFYIHSSHKQFSDSNINKYFKKINPPLETSHHKPLDPKFK